MISSVVSKTCNCFGNSFTKSIERLISVCSFRKTNFQYEALIFLEDGTLL
jgi:hypothetical protein